MSLIRKHVAVLQAWACLDLVGVCTRVSEPCWAWMLIWPECIIVQRQGPQHPHAKGDIWGSEHPVKIANFSRTITESGIWLR